MNDLSPCLSPKAGKIQSLMIPLIKAGRLQVHKMYLYIYVYIYIHVYVHMRLCLNVFCIIIYIHNYINRDL